MFAIGMIIVSVFVPVVPQAIVIIANLAILAAQ